MPASIFEVVPWIREQLGTAQSRAASSDEQAAEEARERASESAASRFHGASSR